MGVLRPSGAAWVPGGQGWSPRGFRRTSRRHRAWGGAQRPGWSELRDSVAVGPRGAENVKKLERKLWGGAVESRPFQTSRHTAPTRIPLSLFCLIKNCFFKAPPGWA